MSMRKRLEREYVRDHSRMFGQIGSDAASAAMLFKKAQLFRPKFQLPVIRLAPVAPYGKCMALSGNGASLEHVSQKLPNGIWLYLHEAFYGIDGDGQQVAISEAVLHELLHWELHLYGEDAKHIGEPWARRCQEISQQLGLDVKIERPRSRRIDGRVTKETPAGCLSYASLVVWPTGLFTGGLHRRKGTPSLLDRCSSVLQATNSPQPIGGDREAV